MSEQADDARISEIRARHVAFDFGMKHPISGGWISRISCKGCHRPWPCEQSVLGERLDALAAEAADVARENEALIEEVKAAGEQIAALAAERDESVANMTATAAAFARLKANSEAWHDDSKRLHNEYLPTAAIMDEVLATRDRAIMDAWAERDAARAWSARWKDFARGLRRAARQHYESWQRACDDVSRLSADLDRTEAERDALRARAERAEAAIRAAISEIDRGCHWDARAALAAAASEGEG